MKIPPFYIIIAVKFYCNKITERTFQMKKNAVLAILTLAVSCAFAAIPEPAININFTGGDFAAIKDQSANKCKVAVASKEKLSWVEENGEKILSFSGDAKQPRGVVLVFPPKTFKISNGFTLFFKIKTAANHNQKARIQLCQYGYGADKINGFSLFLFWKAFHCRYGADAKTTVATNAKANLIKPDTWYDAVMTYNGKNITLYLNGKVVKSAPAVIPDVKNTFTIGATANRGGGYAFQGLVKNMKLYEKALLPEEVIELK